MRYYYTIYEYPYQLLLFGIPNYTHLYPLFRFHQKGVQANQLKGNQKNKPETFRSWFREVLVAGVEPARPRGHEILSFPVASDHNGRKVVLEDGTSRRKSQSRQGKNAENRRKPLW